AALLEGVRVVESGVARRGAPEDVREARPLPAAVVGGVAEGALLLEQRLPLCSLTGDPASGLVGRGAGHRVERHGQQKTSHQPSLTLCRTARNTASNVVFQKVTSPKGLHTAPPRR